ncbi:hypothetical protein EI94DRAFT_1708061 [Lactarius quietus]|nr:hypothetical protein EI94DRAFT_1708061 [Lactarius quietus]
MTAVGRPFGPKGTTVMNGIDLGVDDKQRNRASEASKEVYLVRPTVDFRRWGLFLAFLIRRLSVRRLWDDQERVTASGASLAPALLSLGPSSHQDHVDPSSVFDTRTDPNRSGSTDSSDQRASGDRASIIQTHVCESLPHTHVGQPTPFPRALPRQYGRGSSLSLSSLSSELSGPPSPEPQLPPLEIDVTIPHNQTQHDRRNSLISSSSITSHGHRRRQSSTSVVVEVVNPSTESLSHRFITDRPLTEEPYIIGSPTGHLSVPDIVDLREGLPPDIPQVTTSDSSPPSCTTLDSDLDLPSGRFMTMIHSEQVPRFTKFAGVQVDNMITIIRPLQYVFWQIPRTDTLRNPAFDNVVSLTHPEQDSHLKDCAPWVPATHPDGALYFFDQERRLFTDTNMLDPILREEMETFYQYLQRVLRYEEIDIPSKNYDLVLDVMPCEDGQIMWSYHYACHEARCLFWFDPYDASYMISERLGVRSPAHITQIGVTLLTELCDDFKASSTLPFDSDTMQKMLALVRDVKKSDAGLVYHTAAVKAQTAYADAKRQRTLLIASLSPALFLAPEGYLRELEKEWVDEVIIEANWRNFISGLLKEWEQLILSVFHVMLSANVGFLAIPGVVISDINNNITGTGQAFIFTSPAQIASCMSIVASVGSIVIGLLLVRRTSPKQNEGSAGARTVAVGIASENTHRIFGLEPLAIAFSLPWALLMWSYVVFRLRISSNSFMTVSSGTVHTATGWLPFSSGCCCFASAPQSKPRTHRLEYSLQWLLFWWPYPSGGAYEALGDLLMQSMRGPVVW